ncbi:MAG: hypothetical protein D6689_22885, partial [Deltaproteobacteria bacterium]
MSNAGNAPKSGNRDPDLLDDLDDKDGRLRARLEAFIPDLVRRGLVAGVGAVMSTEEGLRKLTRDLSLPKDVATYL